MDSARTEPGTFSPTAIPGLLLACLLVLAKPAAHAVDQVDWDEWKAPVFAEIERWFDERGAQNLPITYAAVFDAYEQAVTVFVDQPLESIKSDALRAHIGLIHYVSFPVFALPSNELGGFSPIGAYGEALVLWQELKRRGGNRAEEAEKLFDMAIGARDFDRAFALNEDENLGFSLPPGVRSIAHDGTMPGAAIWRLDEEGWLSKDRFVFPEGLHWVVASSEGCGFFQLFTRHFAINDALNALLRESLTWLIMPNPNLNMEYLNEGRKNLVAVEPLWMHVAEDWLMFEELLGSPVLYLMRGSEALDYWVGWPRDMPHLEEMLAAWEANQG